MTPAKREPARVRPAREYPNEWTRYDEDDDDLERQAQPGDEPADQEVIAKRVGRAPSPAPDPGSGWLEF